MRIPMGFHAIGIAALGFVPVLGLKIVAGPAEQFLKAIDAGVHGHQAMDQLSDTLTPLSEMAGLVIILTLSVWFLKRMVFA